MALFTGHTITPDSALGGVKIERSVRLNKADAGHFQRTVSSGGNQKIWTWSAWIKRTRIHDNGGTSYLFSCNNVSGNNGIAGLYIQSDQLYTYFDTTGTNPYGSINSRKLRDMTSWMHIVWQVDASNTSQKVWINGVELSLDSGKNPPDYSYGMNQSGIKMFIGRDGDWGGDASNMYVAEVHYSDGTKYQASDFGYTDTQTGQWRPKNGDVIKSNITYGTNGYWLDFRDNTNTTTLGYDYSGNANHFTATNISVSAGYGNDSLEDTPTNNACIFNDQDEDGSANITNGGLQIAQASDPCRARATHGMPPNTGMYYYEMTVQTGSSYTFGMKGTLKLGSGTSGDDGKHVYYGHNGYKYDDSGGGSYGATYGAGDTVSILYDSDSGEVYFYKNGASQGLAFTGVNNTTYLPYIYLDNYGTAPIVHFNFGQRPFAYTLPTGAKGLGGKYNVTPVPAGVVRPQRHFDILTWSGNSTNGHTIDGLEFTPDLVWIKNRSEAVGHYWVDSMRKSGSDYLYFNTNETNAEGDASARFTSINRGGFTLPGGGTFTNSSGDNFVAWCWKAGGAGVSNTEGNITSSVSVNEEAGFSIVTYTGNGSNGQTVGHGLSQAPQWILLKARDASQNWRVWHHKLAADGSKRLLLDATNASEDASFLNDTAPTSTVFTLGNADDAWNSNSDKFIAYCWHEIPGYSKFGTYRGTGNSNGAFVHLGFRPAWLMTKRSNSARNWLIFDIKRDVSNVATEFVEADTSIAEATINGGLDFLSDGFKIVTSDTDINGADTSGGDTYIFMAFAERPSGSMFGLDANAR